MSSTFKLAKKKYSQNDLRRLMQDQKKPEANVRIQSPLAKYCGNELTCILCKKVVKNSEAVWKVHVNAKQHTANVAVAKQLKEKIHLGPKSAPPSNKRPHESIPVFEETVPTKKIKSILKGSNAALSLLKVTDNLIPADFFDAKTTKSNNKPAAIANGSPAIVEENIEDDKLPEGFFDDPKKDAKARNQEYKDANEEEWEKFQKEIKLETTTSAAIIDEEQEEATAEREIDEIDEQIRNWSR